ncbi:MULTISPECIES: hypothetical protein [Paraburkholderia]|nr:MULTISPECIES: hypothetical protein [Paraburkholderia]MBB5411176.1 hypothetical protein [Paraburkholderia sp. HC6.4b]MBB5453948.1 hypothetical protein [Paraburkholderia sp. Kb1A]MBC8725581.1 hypothetical protein [Paraburkholderia sp. 31.1]
MVEIAKLAGRIAWICDDVGTPWDVQDRKQAVTKLLSLNMGGEIGKQSGKRHGANEDQKDPHWPQPCWRLKRRQQGCGRAKLASRQVFF